MTTRRLIQSMTASVLIALLGGCAMPLTEHNASSITVPSPLSVERTYRNVLAVLEVCYPALHTVESNYFPDAKEGVISLSSSSDYSRVWFFKMTLATEQGQTVMRMQSRSNFPRYSEAMAAWAKGEEGGCPYGNKYDPKVPVGNRMG